MNRKKSESILKEKKLTKSLALAVMVVANRFAKIPLRRMLIWACLALVLICIWNASSIGLV